MRVHGVVQKSSVIVVLVDAPTLPTPAGGGCMKLTHLDIEALLDGAYLVTVCGLTMTGDRAGGPVARRAYQYTKRVRPYNGEDPPRWLTAIVREYAPPRLAMRMCDRQTEFKGEE